MGAVWGLEGGMAGVGKGMVEEGQAEGRSYTMEKGSYR